MKKLIRFIAAKSGFATLAILTGLLLPIGLAAAAGTIGSLDIINGQVKTVDLANRAVTSAKIKCHHAKGLEYVAVVERKRRAVAVDHRAYLGSA